MADALVAFAVALGVVFVAEFADKTQFAILAMSGRGHPAQVFAGAAAAFVVMAIAAAFVGDLVGDRLPLRWVAVVAGVVFIVLGVLGLRRETDHAEQRGDGGEGPAKGRREHRNDRQRSSPAAGGGRRGRDPVARRDSWIGAFVLILLAEFGDRTQIAIVALSARNGHPWWTAAGAALALLATAAITVAAGHAIRARFAVQKVERAAAILFIAVGSLFVLTPWLPIAW